MLLARAFASIPVLNPALRISLFSASCGVATILVTYFAMRRWGLGAVASLLSGCTLAASPTFWRYAGVPEVFALGTLLAAGLLWAVGRGKGPRGAVRGFSIGLLFGLGLANHHSMILLLPLVMVGLIRTRRETTSGMLIAVMITVAGLVVGLSPYLTLLLSPQGVGWQ
jgi:hypothetical protein